MRSRAVLVVPLGACMLLLGGCARAASAQPCSVPDSIRGLASYADGIDATTMIGSGAEGFANLDLGVGHLHQATDVGSENIPPGEYGWLRGVEIPLSPRAGADASSWIAGGRVITQEGTHSPLTMNAMLETGYEEPSFIVLEESDDWLRIRYSDAEGARTAWVPVCALETSAVQLEYSAWSEWLAGDHISPLFLRTNDAVELRAEPSAGSAAVAAISGDYIMEPLEVRGDWMRVELRQPSDYCFPDVKPNVREGWIRWREPGLGPTVWYFTRGC